MLDDFKRVLWLSRPYSWTGALAIALLTIFFISNKLVLDWTLAKYVAIFLFGWVSLCLSIEVFQRDKTKGKTGLLIFLGLFFVEIFLISSNIFALTAYFLLFISTIIYSLKAKNFFFSPFVFLLRGVAEIGLISILLLLHNQSPFDQKYFSLIIPIYFITVSRNLVGDVRDSIKDKFTFPKKFGISIAYAVSTLLLIPVFLFVPDLTIFATLVPVIVMMLLRWNGYFVHSFYVLTTLFFAITYLSVLSGYGALLPLILFLGIVLSFTYDLVPRKLPDQSVRKRRII